MNLFYIGAFPPKWGGVTVKNNDLYNALTERGLAVQKVNLNLIKRKRSLTEACRLIKALSGKNNRLLIGISAGSRRSFVRLLYYADRHLMGRSLMIVMGGAAARDISADSEYMRWMKEFRRVYVETSGMLKMLKIHGMQNVSIYPNCRRKIEGNYLRENTSELLRCVFFSTIQKEKGTDIIIKSAEKLPGVEFTFYGPVDSTYKAEFEYCIKTHSNCTYKGIFKGTDESKYQELSKYDILLLPTRWTTEGVPGILVEAKIAGLACIVSDVSFNSEIIRNCADGIVLEENDERSLTQAISMLNEDRSLLNRLKSESCKSAEAYYIESYIDEIIRVITQ